MNASSGQSEQLFRVMVNICSGQGEHSSERSDDGCGVLPCSGSEGGVFIKWSGAQRATEMLEEKVGLGLQLDGNGRLQTTTVPSVLSVEQQGLLDAMNSREAITINTEARNKRYNFGKTEGHGVHDVDMSDLDALNDPDNHTVFTAGNVILHEIMEGLGEVRGISRDYAHQYANGFAPGISAFKALWSPSRSLPARVRSIVDNGFVKEATFVTEVEDGASPSSMLAFRVALRPPVYRRDLESRSWLFSGDIIDVQASR